MRTPAATPGDIRESPDPAPSSVTLFDPTEDARAFVIAQEPFPTERSGGEEGLNVTAVLLAAALEFVDFEAIADELIVEIEEGVPS